VLRQDAVDRRTQPHEPAAQCERIKLEWLDNIVDAGISGNVGQHGISRK
jgi:hypothetical protein